MVCSVPVPKEGDTIHFATESTKPIIQKCTKSCTARAYTQATYNQLLLESIRSSLSLEGRSSHAFKSNKAFPLKAEKNVLLKVEENSL